MEKHRQYGQVIYTHDADQIYVDLQISSELYWKDKDVTITQKTDFPDSESSELKINTSEPKTFTLNIRYPKWTKNGVFTINGETYATSNVPGSYVNIEREWKDGDVINFTFPMSTYFLELPNVPEYVALMHGPILLGAKTGDEHLDGLIAGDARMDHVAHGKLYPLNEAPVLVTERDKIIENIEVVDKSKFIFKA